MNEQNIGGTTSTFIVDTVPDLPAWWYAMIVAAIIVTIFAVASIGVYWLRSRRRLSERLDKMLGDIFVGFWATMTVLVASLWTIPLSYLSILHYDHNQTEYVESGVQEQIGDPDARADWGAIRRLESNIVISGEDYICEVTRLEKVFGPAILIETDCDQDK